MQSSITVQKKPSRQRPVSCHFCRSRKLRCSRRFPCPNCTSRGISCQLYTSQLIESYSEDSTSENTCATTADILARLRNLEDIVLRNNPQVEPSEPGTAPNKLLIQPQNPGREKHAAEDARWLELECSISGVSNIIKRDKAVFRACPIRQIKETPSVMTQGFLDVITSADITKCFWVPLYEESRLLVEKYVEELTYVLHVIHIPSVRATVDYLYEGLHRQVRPKSSHVALLLSIIANTLYSWTSRDSERMPYLTIEDTNRCASVWLNAALDLLEHVSQASHGSLEAIQARIITASLVCNLEGVSSRYRSLILTAITGARELGLHRIDNSDDPASASSQPIDTVEAETGRRVWWYLVATDWVLSYFEGPLKGTYTINPHHMSVRKPRNIDDTDLVHGAPIVERPMEYPTHVSYTLQRIKLGEICRELTDRTSIFRSQKFNYDIVLENDKKTNDYISGFPAFFRLDGGSLNDVAKVNPDVAPGIMAQRYILNVLAHAHRCRLHLPYFAKASVNPTYAYSRDVCLDAARAVIRTERLFEKESISFVLTRFRFAGSLHCLGIAIVVFVLDVCLYKDQGQEEERRREASDACSILQKAKNDSSIAARLLRSFMRIVRKHKVSINGISNAGASEGDDIRESPDSYSTPIHLADALGPSLGYDLHNVSAEQSLLSPSSSYWNGLRETLDIGMESIDWNALFFELDVQSFDGGSLF
ncbi:uncharacterized protein BJX67DRAFT_358864 [Aspergillus lucknowensis]|uniref:Zn(2)-C6 fungal-type domain-containing protein n=1 Tax=Aspergillus lucknowensis TaxID=176173 RepID=A0ABR4LLL4_9EURO